MPVAHQQLNILKDIDGFFIWYIDSEGNNNNAHSDDELDTEVGVVIDIWKVYGMLAEVSSC